MVEFEGFLIEDKLEDRDNGRVKEQEKLEKQTDQRDLPVVTE